MLLRSAPCKGLDGVQWYLIGLNEKGQHPVGPIGGRPMTLQRKVLIGSASGIALLCATAPAMAQDKNSSTVNEVVVTGIRQSLEKAIEVKKLSTNQVDAISATDIGKLPDKNVADA